MRFEDRDPATLTITDLFVYLVEDDDAAAGREHFCDVVATQLVEVASWLGVDAWLGAGDVVDTSATERALADDTRHRSFVAVALVAQISGQLVSGAQRLLRDGNEYAAFALVRQLIECEYLLRVFGLDFAEGARWLVADEKVLRTDFKPSALRKVGGFDSKEYFDHCQSGGHPHPKARMLLELPRSFEALAASAKGEREPFDLTRAHWQDFTFHCDRTWQALHSVLSAEHARYERVRAEHIAAVADARASWQSVDRAAQIAGPMLAALAEDPHALLSDLIGETGDDEP